MSKLIWKDEYKDVNSTSSIDKIHDTLFFPSADEIISYIADGIKAKDESFRFMYIESTRWHIIDHIVITQLPLSEGRINIGYLKNAVDKVFKIYNDLERLVYLLKHDNYRDGVVHENPIIIGEGVLIDNYDDSDPDPYMTAGGYRHWRALEGTPVEYKLNQNLSISLVFDSNCMVDHYNNNIGGLSTGGGTTEYVVGQRVEKRSVTLGIEAFFSSWRDAKIKSVPQIIYSENLKNLLLKYQPELCSTLDYFSKKEAV